MKDVEKRGVLQLENKINRFKEIRLTDQKQVLQYNILDKYTFRERLR